MRNVLRLGWNDVVRTARDRTSFIWMLALPIALMWFFGQVGSGGSPAAPKIALTVDDRDGGWLAEAFVEELNDESVALVAYEPPAGPETPSPARVLVIPEGFTEGALAGEQQTLRLDKHPDASREFSMAAEVLITRTIVRMLGRLIEAGTDPAEGLPDRLSALAGRERLIDLVVETAGEGRPVPSGVSQSVPGMLTMMVLMMTLIYGGVFLTLEKRDGTLRRQLAAPNSPAGIYLGKFLGRLMLCGLQTAVLLAAGMLLFGLSFGSPLGLVVLLTSYAMAVAGLATLLGAVLRTPEQASAIGWLLSMVLAAMGGCWWPSEVMPRGLWQAMHILPTAWAMDGFHALISFGAGLEGVAVPSLALMGFAVVFTGLGARFLRVT
jgi:ABC-type multidrug transport system permease subunit